MAMAGGTKSVTAPPGRLIVFSGPSGAGKTTVVRELMVRCPLPLVLSVSATTRPARPGEVDGVDYHFLSADEFQRRRELGDFLECFEVFGRGYWYGTLRSTVTENLQQGKWIVLEIDVHGMRQVQAAYPEVTTFFIRPASLAELERRLRGRGTESEQTIQRRLEVARQECESEPEYDHVIVNQTVPQAVADICERLKSLAEV
ncbi:MAG: guanylate kinase [Pirellulales bacterium]